MGPKVHHRTASSSRLGPNSRSSSSSRLTTNLQFTQKEPQYPAVKQPQPTQSKKNDARNVAFHRGASTHRIASKDQLQPTAKRSVNAAPKSNGLKTKKGFIIASSPSDEADDDEWVSSESGAATPNHIQGSDSGDDSELVTPAEQTKLLEGRLAQYDAAKIVEEQDRERAGGATPIPRVDPLVDSQRPRGKLPAEPSETQPPHSIQPTPQRSTFQQQERRASLPPMVNEPGSFDNLSAVPRPPTKRHSTARPPSTHSTSSRHDTLRPHPLIRGQSYGNPNKLASLAMTSDVASAQLSSTPPVKIEQSMPHPNALSASPATTPSTSPSSSPSHLHRMPSRRTSVSSTRSVATLPVHTSIRDPPRQIRDRNRTLSTISSSSSSAAISSLAHIPATRPPSPQRLSVIFPPPSHPQFHTAGVHSLLPPPYLTNHLTTLAHRTPLRESYDRVRRAKFEARR
ncbi:hypothetical protein GYMLUDRAFT_34904 [Collybiopsis luxurians FD-317 M1]|nr:hypothetical protein GYMLUDRAFT_34904 [Collybiopsis luxurians FD-317 M1]